MLKVDSIVFSRTGEQVELDVYFVIRKEGVGFIKYGMQMPYNPYITFREFEEIAAHRVEKMHEELLRA